MSVLNELRFVTLTKPLTKDPIVLRREKFIERLVEQKLLIEREIHPTLASTHNESEEGEGKQRNSQRSKSPWWWVEKDGKHYVIIKYGSKVLELQKGKQSIACDGLLGVKKTLETVEKAAIKGELDSLLQAVGNELRKRFSS